MRKSAIAEELEPSFGYHPETSAKILDFYICIGYAAPMTVESPIAPGYKPNEKELLETFLLMTLEEHDGLCLDNQPERVALAVDLATALTSAAREGTIDFSRLLELPQKDDNSFSLPLAE